MFMPNVKQQRTYHFTNNRNAFPEAFRFDANRPTSILYERDATGGLTLVGAMYTVPRRARESRLDARIPLSNVFGWMIHASVFASDDPGTIFSHEH